MNEKKLSFEEALSELEKISAQLEAGDLPLDKSIELFEKGVALSKLCSEYLSAAKQKIISLEQAESEENR